MGRGRVSNPGPLALESDALPTALRDPALNLLFYRSVTLFSRPLEVDLGELSTRFQASRQGKGPRVCPDQNVYSRVKAGRFLVPFTCKRRRRMLMKHKQYQSNRRHPMVIVLGYSYILTFLMYH